MARRPKLKPCPSETAERRCGNVAALREALEKFLDLARRGLAFVTSYRYTEEENDELEEAFANAKSALAEPPRNCDRYHTVEEAFAACHEDRGYLSDPAAERRSTISFMLSVAQKEPKFEQCDGESAPTEGDKHGI